MTDSIVVLFNGDLRVHDHPALAAASRDAGTVVPLFVFDDRILGGPNASPNRAALLRDALVDLRGALRRRGGELFLRRGDPATEACRIASAAGVQAIHASADVSPLARRREASLRASAERIGVDYRLFSGATVVAPEDLMTSAGTPYQMFTPYWRAWRRSDRRPVQDAPERIRIPSGLEPGEIPPIDELTSGARSPELPPEGESIARQVLEHLGKGDRSEGGASRLGAHLHFGTLSPLEVVATLEADARNEELIRSLAWRDYFHQLLYHAPGVASADYRPRRGSWRRDDEAFEAWCEGRTGFPVIDAAMRQLRLEGWMHNRWRMAVASFLTKHLGIDWRLGARHFARWLVDGDLANNTGNWQWVAGTGTDTRPNRILNPVRQGRRFDRDGDFVRRYVPELAGLEGRELHEPWRLGAERLGELGYPMRIVDHEAAADAFRERVR